MIKIAAYYFAEHLQYKNKRNKSEASSLIQTVSREDQFAFSLEQ